MKHRASPLLIIFINLNRNSFICDDQITQINSVKYIKKSIYTCIKAAENLQNRKRKSFIFQNSKTTIKIYLKTVSKIVKSTRRNQYSLQAFHGPVSNAQPYFIRYH